VHRSGWSLDKSRLKGDAGCMDVHASPAELPELKEFWGAFQVRFRGVAHRAAQQEL
jgi:hypothetical protein